MGEDILAQAVERQSLCIADLVHDDDRAVFQNEHGSERRLEMLVVVAQNAEVYDRRIAERAVAVLDGGAADENGVCKRFLDGLGGHVENQVLVAGLLELSNDIMQLGKIRAVYAKHDACRSGDLVHSREVILVGAVEAEESSRRQE